MAKESSSKSSGDELPESQGRFVQLFARDQRRIHAFINTLVPNRSDADDVMQEVSLVLWKKWAAFDQERNFFFWACGIARLEVLRIHRKRAADRHYFNEELINHLSAEVLAQSAVHDQRREALLGCLGRLNDRDRRLVEYRYQSGVTARQTAQDLGRPASTVYKALTRIREVLYHCIEQKIAQQSHPQY